MRTQLPWRTRGRRSFAVHRVDETISHAVLLALLNLAQKCDGATASPMSSPQTQDGAWPSTITDFFFHDTETGQPPVSSQDCNATCFPPQRMQKHFT